MWSGVIECRMDHNLTQRAICSGVGIMLTLLSIMFPDCVKNDVTGFCLGRASLEKKASIESDNELSSK